MVLSEPRAGPIEEGGTPSGRHNDRGTKLLREVRVWQENRSAEMPRLQSLSTF